MPQTRRSPAMSRPPNSPAQRDPCFSAGRAGRGSQCPAPAAGAGCNHHRRHTLLGGQPPITRANNPASQYT
ncbi:hypothetical protein FCI23_09625 [Actinacidiphila oryziradicis]|uniref:Uncharacterized protein n=1 Tax=Actinacidiphila oryziradicis TaxID=2571141 RepID=A0A4U0SNN0_9ACTN|nr:hypothetical protein FCI23_09625 [Actinacidiphila oryziradicis]